MPVLSRLRRRSAILLGLAFAGLCALSAFPSNALASGVDGFISDGEYASKYQARFAFESNKGEKIGHLVTATVWYDFDTDGNLCFAIDFGRDFADTIYQGENTFNGTTYAESDNFGYHMSDSLVNGKPDGSEKTERTIAKVDGSDETDITITATNGVDTKSLTFTQDLLSYSGGSGGGMGMGGGDYTGGTWASEKVDDVLVLANATSFDYNFNLVLEKDALSGDGDATDYIIDGWDYNKYSEYRGYDDSADLMLNPRGIGIGDRSELFESGEWEIDLIYEAKIDAAWFAGGYELIPVVPNAAEAPIVSFDGHASPSRFGTGSLIFTSVVPEPSSIVIMIGCGIGLAGYGLRRRRRLSKSDQQS